MPRIVSEIFYDGAEQKLQRLGLAPLLDELRSILTGFPLKLLEKRHGNGAAAIRKLIDERFTAAADWKVKKAGDIDWVKCLTANGAHPCMGVEIQVSARSDLLANDLNHFYIAFRKGILDIGVVVVPADEMAIYLPDRTPRMSDAKRHVERARMGDYPLILIAIVHDGPGEALPKQPRERIRPR